MWNAAFLSPNLALAAPKAAALDHAKIEQLTGSYKVIVSRSATMGGHQMGKAMGVNVWAAPAGSDDQAVIDGDFAMQE